MSDERDLSGGDSDLFHDPHLRYLRNVRPMRDSRRSGPRRMRRRRRVRAMRGQLQLHGSDSAL